MNASNMGSRSKTRRSIKIGDSNEKVKTDRKKKE
jgi:hypothetical protein